MWARPAWILWAETRPGCPLASRMSSRFSQAWTVRGNASSKQGTLKIGGGQPRPRWCAARSSPGLPCNGCAGVIASAGTEQRGWAGAKTARAGPTSPFETRCRTTCMRCLLADCTRAASRPSTDNTSDRKQCRPPCSFGRRRYWERTAASRSGPGAGHDKGQRQPAGRQAAQPLPLRPRPRVHRSQAKAPAVAMASPAQGTDSTHGELHMVSFTGRRLRASTSPCACARGGV